ncbi:sialidase-3-like isoform X1 [Pelobates fuscus]|uniref:sialidase-3-like isoform X1 n=2 Tax=Pelobates fuscus TaxID=191477 RepID=UPI002FE48F01
MFCGFRSIEPAMKASLPERTPLFSHEPNGPAYRIPSLIYIKEENTFVAFAERRKNDEDISAEYVVMRRGIYKTGYVKWEGIQPLHEATMKNHRTMNPCSIYDENSKVLFLFFNCIPDGVTEKHMRVWGNSSKLCYVTSSDFGKTWSFIKDITEVTNGIRKMTTCFLSPGHGIQTQDGKLIIPAYVYIAKFWFIRWWFDAAQSFYLYSADQGHKWEISQRIVKYNSGECELAEICDDGKNMLYCNARSTSVKRVEALSLNIGGEFKFVEKSRKLKEIKGGCHGSVLSFLGGEETVQNHNHWLMFSHPIKNDRRDLGIFLNKFPLKSESWSKPWVIYEGFSGYSNLVDCQQANTFAVLFEGGDKTHYEHIYFCLFTLEDVLENIKKKKSLFARFKK